MKTLMNIRDLKYLVAVADHNHFGKAAEECFVSQPALSMQIKKLEESLGVLLIERTNKRIFFTEIGKLIVQQARDILYRVESLQEVANQSKDPFCGELHLGIIPTLAPYLLPLIIPGLSTLFPQLTLYLVEDTTLTLLTTLNEGKLDGALLALPIEGDFVVHSLFDEEFVLAVPLGHPLAKQKIANFSDLENKTLLLLEDGHCLRDQALAVCRRAHASESKKFRATSLETLRHMVAAGVGITLLPKLSCRSNDGVCYLPFTSPIPMRTIGLIWRGSAAKKILLEHLVGHIKNVNHANLS
ncbi:MAG: DNA-binding transcriptional regulator OxyR [bacterium]|nr:DNA-binding transcriptional regulator OxyR [bacterium]